MKQKEALTLAVNIREELLKRGIELPPETYDEAGLSLLNRVKQLEKIKDFERYDPRKIPHTPLGNKQLADDWRIVMAAYATVRRGKPHKWPLKHIIDRAKKIYDEIVRRVKAGEMKHEFKPEEMKPLSRELYNKVRLMKFIKAEKLPGRILEEPHAKWLWQGQKKLIASTKKFTIDINRPVYLCGEYIYGIIEIGPPLEVDLEEFTRLQSQHLITPKQRKEWWPDAKKFYVYQVRWIRRFAKPKPYKRPRGPQTHIREIAPLAKMRKPFTHPYGKTGQLKVLKQLIPEHKIYVEPFAGGAALYYAKEPSETEVLNDLDPIIYLTLKFIKGATPEEIEELRSREWVASREHFEKLKQETPKSHLDKIYQYLYLTIHSFDQKGKNYVERPKPRGMPEFLKNPELYQKRMAETLIFNRDYQPIVEKYDSPDTFFYFDPPYYENELKEPMDEFLARLKSVLDKIKGKWLLSWNDTKQIRETFKEYEIRGFTTWHQWPPGGAKQQREVVIANYPLPKRLKKATATIKFLGTKGFIEEETDIHKHHSATLITYRGKRLLIDWGETFRDTPIPAPDYILITHLHPDHFGGLKPQHFTKYPIYIFDVIQTAKLSKALIGVPRTHTFTLGPFKIRSFPIRHSIKAPNVGLVITLGKRRILYATDVLSIPKAIRDELRGLIDIYIGDGATLKPEGLVRIDKETGEVYGHASMQRQLKWADDMQIPTVIFTHLGKEALKLGDKQVKQKLHGLGLKPVVFVARDGQEVSLRRLTKQVMPRVDPTKLKQLSDEELLALDTQLHQYYRRVNYISEELLNAHIFVWHEIDNRKLPHRIEDELTRETRFWIGIGEYLKPPPVKKAEQLITLQEVIDCFPEKIKLTRPGISIHLCGRIVNEGKVPAGHDIDIRIEGTHSIPDPTIAATLLAACNRPDIRESIEFIWQEFGGIGYSIPLYTQEPDKTELNKATLRIGKPSQPQKAATGELKNEFWEEDDCWENFVKPRLDQGKTIMVQPKADGMAMQVHYQDGKVIGIYTEGGLRNRVVCFKKSAAELPKLTDADSLILAAEMVEYTEETLPNIKPRNLWQYKQIPREDLVKSNNESIEWFEKWIAAKPEKLDDERVAFFVHNLLYINGKDITKQGALERWQLLRKTLKDGTHWWVTPNWLVRNREEYDYAMRKARYWPNSEGAILLTHDCIYKIRYDVAARNKDVAKLKNLKSIDVMVRRLRLIKGQKDVFRAECYIGPIPKDELDRYRERDIWWYKGKPYLYIGMSYYLKGRVPIGSIIEIMPVRIEFEIDERTGKEKVTWMFPKVGAKRPEKKEPDPIDVARKIARLGTRPMEKAIRLPLEPCPFYKRGDICLLSHYVRLVEKAMIEEEYLRFPIACKLAWLYKCIYVKRYYYGWRQREI